MNNNEFRLKSFGFIKETFCLMKNFKQEKFKEVHKLFIKFSPQHLTEFNLLIFFNQIRSAIQQPGFKRVKRGFRTLKSPTAISNHPKEIEQEAEMSSKIPTDPYFPLQWYLRNTGQNGGKVRLDLNVQAAWDQGITGKNVTTAIMDDGKQ